MITNIIIITGIVLLVFFWVSFSILWYMQNFITDMFSSSLLTKSLSLCTKGMTMAGITFGLGLALMVAFK